MKYYIAYGSNLNEEQMKWRCPNAKIAGTTMLENYELVFKGSRTGSYLTIEPKKGGEVPVAIWRITDDCEKALDRYEGFPSFYYKKEMTVTMNSGRQIEAFAYIMCEERKYGKPSLTYIETCLKGYRDFGFNESKIYNAIKRSIRRMKHE